MLERWNGGGELFHQCIAVVVRCHALQPAIAHEQIEPACILNFDCHTFDPDFLHWRSRRRWRGWAWCWRRRGYKRRAEKRRGPGIIVNAEHELAALLVNARATTHHLVKQ